MESPSPFAGKWKLYDSENFDALLKAMHVNLVTRQLAKTVTPTLEWKIDGNHHSLKTITTLKTQLLEFNLGEEFEEQQLDGTKVKATIVLDGDKLVHTTKGERQLRIVREVINGELIVTVELPEKKLTSVRKYKRI